MSVEKIRIDVAIIGGGIIGLWSAFLLKQKRPHLEIVLIEKNLFLGDETTGRNSGVLHSGLYYPTDSLKHLSCLEGYNIWLNFCEQYGIPYQICGKYLISRGAKDQAGLEKYFLQAKQNGVSALRVSTDELKNLEKDLFVSDAVFIKSSGIIDVPFAIRCLKNLAESLGVIVLTAHSLEQVNLQNKSSHFELLVKTPDEVIEIESQLLVNAAGLGAVQLRKMLGLNNFENYWVKGNYLKTSQKLDYKNLYYPIPSPDLLGLGIHSTIDIQGLVKFGPNTQEMEISSTSKYSLDPAELSKMLGGVSKLFKNIDPSRLYLDYCGIRPKLKNSDDLKIHSDFYLDNGAKNNMPNYFEFLGIESPGVTAAPALASKLVNMIFTD